VPGRGPAAHHRCRDARQADRGKDRDRRLAEPCRPVRQLVRQCRHLGPRADRPAGRGRRGGGARPAGPSQAADHAAGRARDPAGGRGGGPHHRRAVRPRPHHRRRAGSRSAGRPALLLRHAGRGRADSRGCRTLRRALCRRDRAGGAGGARAGAGGGPRHFGEALRAQSALRGGPGEARLGRAISAPQGPRADRGAA
jgi:hypothetical protein